MLKPYKRAEVSFEQRQEIGHEGNNSQVHVAYDPGFDAELVIKTVPKARLDVDAYFSESRLLYKSSHPNVVPLFYAAEDADSIYLAMPFFPRGSLNSALSATFLTMREVIRYATYFLSGLHNVHSKNLVHFDVKPDNILLTDRDEALLSDFGLAKKTDHGGFAEQDRMYIKGLPPEYLQHTHCDLRADIYQSGLTLYRLVNGNKRFYEQFDAYGRDANFDRLEFRHDVINEQFPDRGSYLEHVPNRFRKVIATCLKSTPAERYKSATEIVSALAEIGGADLDWRYQEDGNGGRKWTKIDGQRELRIQVEPAGRCTAEKRRGGDFKRIKKYCRDAISSAELSRFLRSDGEE
jgi:eukaryotic-like serine/threonine-protein kinase